MIMQCLRFIILFCVLIIFIFLLFNSCVLISFDNEFTNDVDPTYTPQPVKSLFENDTCSSPCWFGLTPGITQASEIFATLELLEDVTDIRIIEDSQIHPIYGYVESGFYDFDFMDDGGGGIKSYIRIDNQVLNLISISVRYNIFLRDVFLEFDNPDKILATNSLYVVVMVLFYDDNNLIVILEADNNECKITNIQSQFLVRTLYYYDEDFRDRLIRSQRFTESYFVQVMDETLETWYMGDNSITCSDVINTLFDLREQNEQIDD